MWPAPATAACHHPRVLAIALGLGSSLCWGFSDFIGGLQSRRLPVLAVMLISQSVALTILVVAVVAGGGSAPKAGSLLIAAGAGLAGIAALGAFYRGLAIGRMSVVAPVSAAGAALPVIVGLARGDSPSVLVLVGMAAAIAGVMLVARQAEEPADALADGRPRARRGGVGLALLAALGFGSFFVGMGEVGHAGVWWVLMAGRTAGVAGLVVAALITRPALHVGRAALGPLLAVGILDTAANGLYVQATTEGLLSIVAVLASVYPVVTIALAVSILRERVRPLQGLGMALVLGGVGAIVAG